MKVLTDEQWSMIQETVDLSLSVAVTIDPDEEVKKMRRLLRETQSLAPKEGGMLTPGTMQLFKKREEAVRRALANIKQVLGWIESLPAFKDEYEEKKIASKNLLHNAETELEGAQDE